jgi:hypothetical protein
VDLLQSFSNNSYCVTQEALADPQRPADDNGEHIHNLRVTYPSLAFVPDPATGETVKAMWEEQCHEVFNFAR